MTVERKSDPDKAARLDGWQKHMEKKASGVRRERRNGSLFCVKVKSGRWREWRPYRRPPSMREVAERIYGKGM